MSRNYVEDLLSSEELKEYQNKDWPDNVSILYSALRKKLEIDPDYEVWVPARYVRYMIVDEEGSPVDLFFKYYMVSNKGRLNLVTSVGNFSAPTRKNNGNYTGAKMILDESKISIRVHRMVATTFIPIPEELLDYTYDVLQVNHLDGDKSNPDVTNLEWTTPSGNTVHAFQTGLRKSGAGINHGKTTPILGEVLIDGPYKGFKFIRSGTDDLVWLMGDNKIRNVYACCHGARKAAKGCKWKFATGREFEAYANVLIPEVLRELIRATNSKVTGPYLCTKLSDGSQFILYKSTDAKQHGMKADKITMCAKGLRKHHAGYTFELIKHEDLKALEEKLKA